jgi:hypothetical protein
MSKISDLQLLYAHRKLAASGDTPATLTASAGTVRTAVCAALTEANDYWNGAIVRWITGPNAGLYSAVADFDAATDTLTFKEDLPSAVANTHQFMLLHGGKYVSDQEIPSLIATALVNVTGFSIIAVGFINGEGTGTLAFKYNGGSNEGLTWTPPGETEGVEVDVSALVDGNQIVLVGGGSSDEELSKFIILERTAAALPGGDESDAVGLTLPAGTFLPLVTGSETAAGKTFYRPVVVKNAGDSKVYGLKAFVPKPVDAAADTTVAAGSGGIGTGADVLDGTSFANWPASGFVYNTDKNDLRYFYDRSGNSMKVLSPGAGIRGHTADAWDEGDDLQLFPLFDIGLDAPGVGDIFEDPADELTAPGGVAFSAPTTAGAGLLIGDLDVDAVYMVWERYFIPAGFKPVEAARALLRLYVEVTS